MIDHNNLYNSLLLGIILRIMLIFIEVNSSIFSKNYIIYKNSLLNSISSKIILRKIDDKNLVFKLGTLILRVCRCNVKYRIFYYFFAEL